MVAKFLTFFGLVSAAVAIALPVAPVSKVVYAEPEAPPQYEYTYSVQDSQSGDVKQQQEARSGDAVRGSYSLIQPDGVQRIVEYTADDQQGFNAVVRYEGTPIEAAPVAKVAYAAPITKVAYAAPVTKVAYAAPVARVAYSAPVAKVAYAAPVTKVAYAPAPITYAAPAPVTYAAPAPVTYAAPAPVTYAQAPFSYAAGPIAKVAYAPAPVAKVAYAQNLGRVTFSSPVVSYQH